MSDRKEDRKELKEDGDIHGSGLRKAASQGNLADAKALLDNGADPDSQDTKGLSPLHFAAKNGHWDVARLLLDRHASPSIVDGDNAQPIIDAAVKGHLEIVRLLIECDPTTVNAQDNFWDTPIIIATRRGDINMVRYLLGANARARHSNRLRQAPLHLAISEGSVDMCELLIEHERINRPNLWARMCYDTPVVETKARGEDTPGRPLDIAVSKGHIRIVELLLRSKMVSPAALNGNKIPLFHCAVNDRNRELARIFLECGVPIDMKGRYKNRALHLAAEKGDVKMVELLLEHGASPKTKNHVSRTPEDVSMSAEVTMILRNCAGESKKGKRKGDASKFEYYATPT
ncbi:hypothetical protein N7456_009728 [Penicillium angulare]|uniref:Uncharacterized protein n=1 Tax=Penicillium angulare TaxID=116970 RepID=A0A9W9F5E8_9EURO|nr:hypothetical protein N7456_009728 [Penicillium angulare]